MILLTDLMFLAYGQQPASTPITLHTTITTRSGTPVPDLPQSAFQVLENGVPQQIRDIRHDDAPTSLGILLDNSGSSASKRAKLEAATLAFLKAANTANEAFLINFNDEAFLDQEFTTDLSKLQRKLKRTDATGGTAMRDAVSMAIDYATATGTHAKKVLLVVTDGNDNSSRSNLERLVEKAQRVGVLVYTVGLLNEEDRSEAKKAQKALEVIAATSGGTAYFPRSIDDLEELMPRIATSLRQQYAITYLPANSTPDGSYRKVRVIIQSDTPVTTRTRAGYYAGKPTPTTQPARQEP